jgi:dTDP-4-amino-4,6-dideoxygalactose transaminase
MEYKIPLFKLNFSQEETQAVIDTINSKWISTGPKCEELENNFQEALNVKHAISLSNCTDALHLAMILNDISFGDEVICPSLTFAASVNCIKYVGAIPVFCEIDSYDNLNISAKNIEILITPKTKAIVVVHMAGFPADMKAIINLAQKYNLKIIEDACHAPLSEYDGKKLGTIGDVGCFSFFSNKNISTGEGGMLVTNNDEIANKCKLLRSHGMTTMSYQRASGHATSYDVVALGYNYRLDDIRASIGIIQLKKLRNDLEERAKIRIKYVNLLKDINEIILPFQFHDGFVSNYIMPIVIKSSKPNLRENVRDFLHKKGIQTSVHYPAIHKFTIYKKQNFELPITEYVSKNEITLPMFATLSDQEINYIVNTLKEGLANCQKK